MKKGFDGEKYEKFSAPQQEWGSKVMDELGLKGSEHILDLGCGNGLLGAKLAAKVPDGKVIGIDSSASMLEQAQKHRTDNLEFLLRDINDLDFEDKFNVVFSNAALHWVADHSLALGQIYRSMKSGGIMRVQFAGEGNCLNLISVLKDAMSSPDFKDDLSSFDWPWYMPGVEEYKKLLVESGFEDLRVWMENADRNFPDEESYVGWIDQPSIVPFVSFLPGNKALHFREHVVREAKKIAVQEDGTYFEYFRRLNVYAIKK
ncbi:methyltransferase domain-containing protein [uncultured Methanolobus sp.]|uniref:methyltransferase domain-containing protein n=1 Tax=uncultured Methanolobus sp. TaxID=218300 RepID=UPI002AAADB8C|nr:methyltransferase domain-containing protein [uncultured Methanolobus sp.]